MLAQRGEGQGQRGFIENLQDRELVNKRQPQTETILPAQGTSWFLCEVERQVPIGTLFFNLLILLVGA